MLRSSFTSHSTHVTAAGHRGLRPAEAMKGRLPVAAAPIVMFLLLVGVAADAAELRVLSALAMQPVMDDLGPKFERATGHKLVVTLAPLGGIVKVVQEGGAGDVVIIP